MRNGILAAVLAAALSAPLAADTAAKQELVLFPVIHAGWGFPHGWEATGGVLLGRLNDEAIEGPTFSARLNHSGTAIGTSLGLGYVQQISFGGFGGNLWLTKYWTGESRVLDAVGADGYLRLFLLEFRLGLGYAWTGAMTTGLYPIIGVDFGI